MKRWFCILVPLLCALALCGCAAEASAAERYAFGLSSDTAAGNAYSEETEGYYGAGTSITVHAVPAEGSAFYCWTSGGYLADGGATVSYEKDYVFPLREDTWLYANFRDGGTARVLYHANGGTATESGLDYLWDEYSLAYYLYPNTLPVMGYFTREGHTLVGYNSEPDGSGAFYNAGGKAFEGTDAVIELWCVWSEQSPVSDFAFSYDAPHGGWVVTDYSGPGGDVSLPDVYENEPVVGVAEGAFSGSESVTSIVFPPSIRRIADRSCDGCTALTALCLFDSLDYVSDASFDGDTELYTVYFGAATDPRYCNWFNNHAKKIEIMNYWKDWPGKKMIVLGGSSTTYAVDAQQLQSELGGEYLVLNCASNGANLFNMTSEWAMRFLKEGDFLLQVAEYSFWQFGGVECRWESFRSFESCYNVFSWVRASKFTKLFDSFNDFLDARRDLTPQSYEDYIANIAPEGYYDDQGTLKVVTRPNGSDSFSSGRRIGFYATDVNGDDWLYDFMIYYCNVQYWKLDEMGVDYALAFTPLNRNSLYDWQTDALLEAWEAYLGEKLNVDIISDIQENIMEPAVFFDDDYHLAAPARAEYTERLARDLNAYFASKTEEETP